MSGDENNCIAHETLVSKIDDYYHKQLNEEFPHLIACK